VTTEALEMTSTERLERLALVRRLCECGEARQIRLEHGLSLADMAAAIGTSPASLSRWELGTKPNTDAALRYGAVLARLLKLVPR
jgi:DNA-binding transcriptional regulator YiaG